MYFFILCAQDQVIVQENVRRPENTNGTRPSVPTSADAYRAQEAERKINMTYSSHILETVSLSSTNCCPVRASSIGWVVHITIICAKGNTLLYFWRSNLNTRCRKIEEGECQTMIGPPGEDLLLQHDRCLE